MRRLLLNLPNRLSDGFRLLFFIHVAISLVVSGRIGSKSDFLFFVFVGMLAKVR
jgi:hypothetical protein